MSIFQVHQRAIEEYRDYIRSFVQVADERLQAFVQAEVLGEGGRLFPEPLLQLSPAYVQEFPLLCPFLHPGGLEQARALA